MPIRLTDFKRAVFFNKNMRALLQYINKFLYANIIIFEFLKKEVCYHFLKHMFREIPQNFWNTIPDFRSDSHKEIFVLVSSRIIDIADVTYILVRAKHPGSSSLGMVFFFLRRAANGLVITGTQLYVPSDSYQRKNMTAPCANSPASENP